MKYICLNNLPAYNEKQIKTYLQLLEGRLKVCDNKTKYEDIVKRCKYIEHYLETKELPKRVRYCKLREEEE